MVYLNQSLLTLELETGVDLSTASSVRINYRKPSGTTGYWSATGTGTKATYNVQVGDLNEAGTWRLQVEATIAARVGFSNPINLVVNNLFIG